MSVNSLSVFSLSITDAQFERIQKLLRELAGISLSDAKKTLVTGRLAKRLRHFGFNSYSDYLDYVTGTSGSIELQTMVDLLTTNETYFFRESSHFDYLVDSILPSHHDKKPLNVWSAASSSGEEIYTIAMVLAEHMGVDSAWTILGSDLSRRVLEIAKSGQYPLAKRRGLPDYYLKKYCLKGVKSQEGTFIISRELRKHTVFKSVNLVQELPDIGPFDVIFLRNVMIYFELETKRKVVDQIISKLKIGGTLIIGHSETLHGISDRLKLVKPTIYVRQE